ncbi:MAG: hypothetical protein EXR75_14810 [Myxococcales bacterium]|nr:hypothetical protein [Myxococcales bacterium]
MARKWTSGDLAAAFLIGGSLVTVAVPSFLRSLTFSKLSEPLDGLAQLVRSSLVYAESRPHELSFPPSAPLTPAAVPRGVAQADPHDAWEHLTWKSLGFRFDGPHAFAFRYESGFDPADGAARFVASAHADLDGDDVLSTFEVRGERRGDGKARVLAGMFVDREVE